MHKIFDRMNLPQNILEIILDIGGSLKVSELMQIPGQK
jgi:hypothetical protein